MLLNQRVSTYVIACITLFSLTFLSSKLSAQVADGINYQAVARDANNNVLANTQITVQFSIVANSATGATVYQELHDDTPTSPLLQTNDFGLFNLIIGRGVRNGGTLNSFEDIDWSSGRYFLRVEIAVGSNLLETLGTTELVSVPFALYAKSSGNTVKAGLGIQVVGKDSVINTGDLSETNELISSFSILAGNVLRITEASTNYDVDLTPLLPASTDSQSLSFSSNGDSILIENGNGIEIKFITDTIVNFNNRIIANQTSSSSNAIGITTNQNDITNVNSTVNTLLTNFRFDSIQTQQNQDSIVILTALIGNGSDDQNLSFSPTRDSILIENGSGIRIQFILDTVANLRSGISNNSTRISGNSAAIITNQNDITNLNTNVNTLQSNFTSDSAQTQQNQDSVAILTTLIGSDNDADSTNELIDSIRFNNRVLEIYQQGNAQTISFDTLYDSRRLSLFNRTISNRDSINAVVALINGITNNDNDSTNEIQQLSLIGDQLTINDPSGTINPAPIDLSIYKTADNLGNHQLDSNLRIGAFYVSGDGDNEGLLIGGDGNSTFTSGLSVNSDQTTAAYPLSIRAASSRVLEIKDAVTNAVEWDINFVGGNLEFNETGVGAPFTLSTNNRVGIATTNPDSTLTVNGGIKSTYFTMTDGAASGRVLTSDANGVATWQTGSTDDQLLSISGTNGTITLEDGGSIQVADSSASNEIQQLSLVGDQLTINDPSGTINSAPIDLSIYNTADNLGNHQLDSNLRIASFSISNDGDDEGISINPDGKVSFSSLTGPSLTIAKESESSLMEFFSYGSGSTAGAMLDFFNHRGGSAAPLSVQEGDRLLTIRSRAFDGAGVAFNELMTMNVDGVVSSGIIPTRTDFNVANDSGVTSTVLTLSSSGNVGIGITTPNHQLHVNSTGTVSFNSFTTAASGTAITDGLVMGYDDNVGAAILNNENSNLAFGTNKAYRMWLNPSGNLGVGTSAPLDKLEVFNAGNVRVRTKTTTTGFSGFVAENSLGEYFVGVQGAADASPGEFHIYQNSPSPRGPRMVIDNVGNLGIGTSAPTVRLTVDGGGDASLTGGGYIMTNIATATNIVMDDNEIMARNNGLEAPIYFQNDGGDFHVHNGQAAGTEFIIEDDGSVGVRTSAPLSDIHIEQSDVAIAGTGGLRNYYSTTYWRLFHSGVHYSFEDDGTRVAYVEGTTGNYVQPSDSTLKSNINEIQPVLGRVMKLRPVSYFYKGFEQDAIKTTGFLAQDVAKELPNLVKYGEGGQMGLAYSEFSVIAIKAIQEQQELIDKLNERIEKLEILLNELKSDE
ncbi:MAG: hypothetical protein ACJASF_000445 [Vicingaceae bacterium]|jgi:hypothetical protein